MQSRLTRLLVAAGVAGTAMSTGCARTPVAPSPQTAMFTGTLQPGYFGPTHEFFVDRDGTVTATLTWTDPRAELNVQLTESRCGVLCKVFSSSEGQAGRVK